MLLFVKMALSLAIKEIPFVFVRQVVKYKKNLQSLNNWDKFGGANFSLIVCGIPYTSGESHHDLLPHGFLPVFFSHIASS